MAGEDRRPSLVYLHGGGFVVGNLDTHDRIMRSLAAKTGAVVVGVDYALAPEAKFPRALEECAAVASWLQRRADALGLDEVKLQAPRGLIAADVDGDGAAEPISSTTWRPIRAAPTI